jgi:hypothetical protein
MAEKKKQERKNPRKDGAKGFKTGSGDITLVRHIRAEKL